MSKFPLANCDTCPLKGAENRCVPPHIVPGATTIIVGESPGVEEVKIGRPFVGPSGQLLRATLEKAGARADVITYTNAVLCQPTLPHKEEYLVDAVAACSPALNALLDDSPDADIVALGDYAQAAVGVHTPFRWEGHRIGLPHPASVLRTPERATFFFRGIRKAVTTFPALKEPDHIEIIHTFEELEAVSFRPDATPISVDVETTGSRWYADDILAVGICYRQMGKTFGETYERILILDGKLLEEDDRARKWLAGVLGVHRHLVGGFNYKFDALFLWAKYRIRMDFAWDAHLEAHAIDEHFFLDLKSLATYYLNAPDYYGEYIGPHIKSKKQGLGAVPFEDLAQYLARDVYYTRHLHTYQMSALGYRYQKFVKDFLVPVSLELAQVEAAGVAVDKGRLENLVGDFARPVNALRDEIITASGGAIQNPASVPQVQHYFFDIKKHKMPYIPGVKDRSTAAAVLAELPDDDPVVSLMKRFRRVHKLLTAFVKPLANWVVWDRETGTYRLFADWRQTGTVTGRPSAAHPPLQTIPRADDEEGMFGQLIRNCFIASPGMVLVGSDGNQWELRVIAAESKDPFMIGVYRSGGDIHGEVAKSVFGLAWTKAQRVHIKRVVFAWAYGGSAESSAQVFQVPRDKVRLIAQRFDSTLQGAMRWRTEQFEKARHHGYLESRLGRRWHFPFTNNTNARTVQKDSVNYPTQGTASDLLERAMVRVGPSIRRLGGRIVLLVHDQLVAEVPIVHKDRAVRLLNDAIEAEASIVYPEIPWVAEAEVGERWGEMEKVVQKGE